MASVAARRSVSPRLRRKVRVRQTVKGSDAHPRLCAYRSSKHTYAQVISDQSGKVLVSASTLEDSVKNMISKLKSSVEGDAKPTSSTKGTLAARAVGLVVAERCKGKNIESVVFDRNGFLYHGRIASIANGAREGGLKF